MILGTYRSRVRVGVCDKVKRDRAGAPLSLDPPLPLSADARTLGGLGGLQRRPAAALALQSGGAARVKQREAVRRGRALGVAEGGLGAGVARQGRRGGKLPGRRYTAR